MDFLLFLSDAIVPLLIFWIVGYALVAKIQVYDVFVKGAEEGLRTVVKIMPTLVGLMVGVGILRASGFLDLISQFLGGITEKIHFPAELVPVTVVRLFSASAATGLALDLFKEYGTDSRIGLLASLMMSCTETVFYTMSLYFMTAKVRKTRYTLAGALFATLAGLVACVVLVEFM
ncbi:MAG: spore maturation protein [Lachnospiraceae bacterium]|nr:spore maturation protein [Lachnospiraceae bacterium]